MADKSARLAILAVLLAAFGHAAAQEGASLIGHWTFDNGANDAAGTFDGQLIGIDANNPALPVATAGKSGQALEFNGGTSVEIPIDLDYQTHPALTVTMWVRLGSKPRRAGSQTLISSGAGHGPQILLARNQVRASAGGRVLGPDHVLTPGIWHFVAVSWDHAAGSMRVTVDNTEGFYPIGYEAELPQKTYISPRDPDFQQYGRKGAQKRYLWIGSKDGFGKRSSLIDVALDDVRIYSGELDAEQLAQLSEGRSYGRSLADGAQSLALDWAPSYPPQQLPGGQADVFPDVCKDSGGSEVACGGGEAVVINHEEQYVTGDLQGLQNTSSGPLDLEGMNATQNRLDEINEDVEGFSSTDTEALAGQLQGETTGPLDLQAMAEEQQALDEQAAAAESSGTTTRTQALEESPAYKPSGNRTLSEVSGHLGDYVYEKEFSDDFLGFLSWEESQNRPCAMWVYRTNDTERVWASSAAVLSECNVSSSLGQEFSKLIGHVGHVRALSVCDNGQSNHRLKGVKIWGADIDGEGKRDDWDVSDSTRFTNCRNWNPVVRCPANTLASGLVAYANDTNGFFADDDEKQITGLRLICREIGAPQ